MKFIKTYPPASATRPGAAVGTVTRKYAILLAMGLTASIASAVLAAVETPPMVGKGASRISTAAIWLLSLLGFWEYVKEVVSGLAAQGDAASRRVGVTHRDGASPWGAMLGG